MAGTKRASKGADRSRRPFDAMIFDLDGVVTATAKVHSAAWKEAFDDYLRLREAGGREPFRPFDEEADYFRYVDGKPRYQGVLSFLRSRGIEIPYGDPSDGPEKETVCGLGNKKNLRFGQLLARRGVEVFRSTVDLVRKAKAKGIKVAVVTSSKNGPAVLKAAGLEALFDAAVDGVVAESLGLRGKPDPDIFLKCAALLGAEAGRCVVFEDSLAGVEAGRAGGFGLVIGMDRRNHADLLKEKGADLVFTDLAGLGLEDISAWFESRALPLPSPLEREKEIEGRLCGKRAALFLDYDGTLTPIVERPELALMPEEMRQVVRDISALCTTAIVSGRAREKLYDLVRVDGVFYAGSHGFDIAGPRGAPIQHAAGKDFGADIDAAYARLKAEVEKIEGGLVEHTGFSLSVHYRLVDPASVPAIEALVERALKEHPRLRLTHGKKVFEIRPKIDWDKGKAVAWILQALDMDKPDILPIYIGDDATDEDAFKFVKGRGIAVVVAEEPRPSAARYRLRDPGEVRRFLRRLILMLKRTGP